MTQICAKQVEGSMSSSFVKSSSSLVLLAGALSLGGVAAAQDKTLPDATVEANVLRAFASAPQLANQAITATTVGGVVTLTGFAQDEASRTLAETLASKASGVQKVVDQLALGAGAPPDAAPGQLQSDGTMAPPEGQQAPYPGQNPQQGAGAPPQYPQQQPYNGAPPQGGYAPAPQGHQPYGAQVAGQAVTISPGSLVRVSVIQGLDTKHTKAGTIFDAIVLNDISADGEVAIPRGATVQGRVVESKNSGALGGHGDLTLELTQVNLAGRVYPLVSDTWSTTGRDKTGQTVGSAVGLGAFGALLGAVAGGGAGAAIGAAAGGAAGLGASAASGGARVVIPSEAILSFHLTQPAPVQTVSQAEMERLGYGVQRLQRRVPPPPPPGYYPPPYPPYAY
jgi:BON domain